MDRETLKAVAVLGGVICMILGGYLIAQAWQHSGNVAETWRFPGQSRFKTPAANVISPGPGHIEPGLTCNSPKN